LSCALRRRSSNSDGRSVSVTRSAPSRAATIPGNPFEFRVWGLQFRVWGLQFRVWGLQFRVWGLQFRG
jgi:hypothetical protein